MTALAWKRWVWAIVSFTAPCIAAPAIDDTERLHQTFRDFEAWQVAESPARAAETEGDRSNFAKMREHSLASLARRNDSLLAFRHRLDEIDSHALNSADRVNMEVFSHLLTEEIGAFEHGRHLLALGPMHGIQTQGEVWFGRFTFASAEDAARYVIHVEELPRHVDDSIALLREGAARGRTLSQPAVDAVLAQLDDLLAGGLEPFGWPFGASWERLAEAERNLIWRRFNSRTLPRVRRAYEKLRDFVADEYRPQCPEAIGFSAQPGGDAFYTHQLNVLTTTAMTAQELHELGLREVDGLLALLCDAIRRTDFIEALPERENLANDELVRVFREFVQKERRFYFESGEELLVAWRDVAKRVDPWLPALFRQLPRLTFGVAEEHSPSMGTAYASYSSGSLEQGIPAMVLVNTEYLDELPRFCVPAMVLHEAAPGHHFQIALADEMSNVPPFRRRWTSGFGEGWAMYAEELGIEMHLYTDPYDDIGRLHGQLWRACRLVVDTGIHAQGWTRDEAATYLRERTVLGEQAIDHDLLRSIGWPAQLTTYTAGMSVFRALREQAEQALGDAFDKREFHDVLLRDGCVPLTTLEWRVQEWLDDQLQP